MIIRRTCLFCSFAALSLLGACGEADGDAASGGGAGAEATTGTSGMTTTASGAPASGSTSTSGAATGSASTGGSGAGGDDPMTQPIDPGDIFAQVDPAKTFESHGWVVAHECAGQTGTFENLDEDGVTASDLGDDLGTLRFGKVDAPDDPQRKALAFHVNIDDPELFGAPRCEISWASSNHDTRIPIKQDFWFAFGLYLPAWTEVPEEGIIAQWHESGPTVNPFMAVSLDGPELKLTLRYNADSSPTQAGNTIHSFQLPGELPVDEWTYFVIKSKISWDEADQPYFHMWRDGDLILEYDDLLGYNSSATPFMKLGLYPWGYDSPPNEWTASVPTKTLFFRLPTYVHADGTSYEEVDLRAYVAAN